jgi:prepilin peptidase CpaA
MGKLALKNLPRNITGLGATFLACYVLIGQRSDLFIVVASVFFILACTVDTLQARIPNILNLWLALTGIVMNTALTDGLGLGTSLLGLLAGFLLLLLPYLMGGFGAGDVKALAALGALIGPQAILHVFVYMAFFGGAMAVLHYVFHTNLKQKANEWWVCIQAAALTRDVRLMHSGETEPLRFPYAAAIAFGYFSYIQWGGVL